MPAAPTLQGFELVTHLFVASTGDADEGHALTERLWAKCRTTFDRPLGSYPEEPVAGARPGLGGILAAAERGDPGVHQALLRREGEIIWLSTVRAPTGLHAGTWLELDAEWDAFESQVDGPVIGSARILQARTDRPAAAADPVSAPTGSPAPAAAPIPNDPTDPAELADVVRAATGLDGDWADAGVRWSDPRLGTFAVWEAPLHGPAPADRDGRRQRRFVVVAPENRDAQLSAGTWTRGAEPAPLGRYLLQSAVLRHEYRLRPDGAALLRDADGRSDRVLNLVQAVAGRAPGSEDLGRASEALAGLLSVEPELVVRSTRLRESKRNVGIAGRNMSLHVGSKATGPFADDRRLADWLERQMDNDATYVDTAIDRVRSVARLGDQIVQRGLQDARERLQDRQERLQRRQERSNLALTGLVGAILMMLAAIQALSYKPPLPPAAVPATVAVLGAFALLLSMIVVRVATAARAAGWALLVAAGLLGAAGGWLVQSSIREGPVGVTVAAACVGAAVAVCIELMRRGATR